MADNLTDNDGDLRWRTLMSYRVGCPEQEYTTIGVAYAPAIAYWENPNPTGLGEPRKTTFVT